MSSLTEIEAAADARPPDQKQELLLYLAARLRDEGAPLPEPRLFPPDRLKEWIAEDEADMERFRESK
jgi:hypothetical protein